MKSRVIIRGSREHTYVGSRDQSATAWAAAEWQPYSAIEKVAAREVAGRSASKQLAHDTVEDERGARSEGQVRTGAVKRSRANSEGERSSKAVGRY